MRRVSILALSFFSLFSCATTPQVIEKEVIVKCPIPEVPKTERPVIKPKQPATEKLQSLLNYMFKLERENQLLREVIDTCRQ